MRLPQHPACSLSSSSRLQHIMAEMISTEREYVRSLGYVVDNYFPEMERADLPPDLRGKRSIIFGNLEKLYDFHQRHFLTELERCRHCPLAAGRGFLRHVSPPLKWALSARPQSSEVCSAHPYSRPSGACSPGLGHVSPEQTIACRSNSTAMVLPGPLPPPLLKPTGCWGLHSHQPLNSVDSPASSPNHPKGTPKISLLPARRSPRSLHPLLPGAHPAPLPDRPPGPA